MSDSETVEECLFDVGWGNVAPPWDLDGWRESAHLDDYLVESRCYLADDQLPLQLVDEGGV